MVARWFVGCLFATALASCRAGLAPAPGPTSTTAALPRSAPARDPVADRAAALVAHAAQVEPGVTPLLVELAALHGGEMVKLEFRLKTAASTARKLAAAMAADGVGLSEVRIEDALRYTLRVDDEPPGRYVATAKATLAALEQRGYRVEYVKNYWPANDNYSGLHCVLRDPSGLFWELQLHTSASLDAQRDTREHYEELRRVDTPEDRQRELFDAMTARWSAVPIPVGVLDEGAVHPRAQLRERARP